MVHIKPCYIRFLLIVDLSHTVKISDTVQHVIILFIKLLCTFFVKYPIVSKFSRLSTIDAT